MQQTEQQLYQQRLKHQTLVQQAMLQQNQHQPQQQALYHPGLLATMPQVINQSLLTCNLIGVDTSFLVSFFSKIVRVCAQLVIFFPFFGCRWNQCRVGICLLGLMQLLVVVCKFIAFFH